MASTHSSSSHKFWYLQPAADWFEALPVGNGRMGAMVFGDPVNERIQLNEDSMWPLENNQEINSKGTPADLKEIRSLLNQGKHYEASLYSVKHFSYKDIRRSQQSLGYLHLNWKNNKVPMTDYRRELDLTSGIINVRWTRGETKYRQEIFCSHPDEALYIRLTARGPEKIELTINMDRPQDGELVTHRTRTVGSHKMEMSGRVTQTQGLFNSEPIPDMSGVFFRSFLKADTIGGGCSSQGKILNITGAEQLIITLTASTDYWPEDERSYHYEALMSHDVFADPVQIFKDARKAHMADHQALYGRCELTLPEDSTFLDIPTDRRLTSLDESHSDPGLGVLLFHYGRYLLIASSRDNGNPAHLQGLWNDKIMAPWNCDYHLNINLQMNYWPAESANLSETHKPLFSYLTKLAGRGEKTAKTQYGMRGWMAHHASELHGMAYMRAKKARWGSWIHGGGWTCQHIWTHYTYTGNKEFLEDVGYPLLAGQARFYLDWLVEEKGKLISYPETSPENDFIDDQGRSCAVTKSSAMGQQIITEVLTNTLSAAGVLGIKDDLTKELKSALGKIDRGLNVGRDGRIKEWDREFPESEIGHRHMSHLYAFHPGISLTEEHSPKLLKAVRKTIKTREENGSVGTGWSRAWAVNIYARLREGATAYHHLNESIRTQTMKNGFNSIFGRENPCFQIEANLGLTAGVAEMLIQSHGGFLHLLPALPPQWSEGSVRGLKARGGHTIDMDWKEGKLVKTRIAKGFAPLSEIKIAGGEVGSVNDLPFLVELI